MKYKLFLLILLVLIISSCSRRKVHAISSNNTIPDTSVKKIISQPPSNPVAVNQPIVIDSIALLKSYYQEALNEFNRMLEGQIPLSFKKAVFITENAFLENSFKYGDFNKQITFIVEVCKRVLAANNLSYEDKVARNWSIFHYMCDTIPYTNGGFHYPFKYDYDDYFGKENWTKMFVVKLLATGSGNCHSLPSLYKIVSEEMDSEAYLSTAPNHMYIQHKDRKGDWFNIELTSGTFPLDGWIRSSSYITHDAIVNGLYMRELNLKESIVICLVDLAKGYERKFGKGDSFILDCVDLALKHDTLNINARLIRAEIIKDRYRNYVAENSEAINSDMVKFNTAHLLQQTMKKEYFKIYDLGYREMPENMYLEWLTSIDKQKEKYQNKNVNFNGTSK